MHKRLLPIFSLFLLLSLTGCAGKLPLPGGSDTENVKFFVTPDDLRARLEGLEVGMSEQDVFIQLGRGPQDMHILDRHELIEALYGSSSMMIPTDPQQQAALAAYLEHLRGYKLDYTNTKRSHGFVNPIRVRTDESGYTYEAALVFEDGHLKQRPVLSGGPVRKAHSQTLFDILTPAAIVNKALP